MGTLSSVPEGKGLNGAALFTAFSAASSAIATPEEVPTLTSENCHLCVSCKRPLPALIHFPLEETRLALFAFACLEYMRLGLFRVFDFLLRGTGENLVTIQAIPFWHPRVIAMSQSEISFALTGGCALFHSRFVRNNGHKVSLAPTRTNNSRNG
jgi:hypothetical protein